MASFNKVILLGNLTRDPELRVTPGGLSICKMGLAVNRTFKDRDGNKREDTTFVDVEAFGQQAEVLSKYMAKGRPLFMEGRLKFDTWENAEGEKRSKLGVVLESFQFIGGRGDDDQSSGGSRGGGYNQEDSRSSAPPSRQPSRQQQAPREDTEDDVPF
ncbi:MAG: single-stranded DNA-binding protein [Opitutales bacterium]|nr:single-stranded DNA-binding protein [Opitutales bacterium]MCH8539310.1 single-stranded DNA-binding protein [Opitutales bacterium]